MLLVGAVEESADVTMSAERTSGKLHEAVIGHVSHLSEIETRVDLEASINCCCAMPRRRAKVETLAMKRASAPWLASRIVLG